LRYSERTLKLFELFTDANPEAPECCGKAANTEVPAHLSNDTGAVGRHNNLQIEPLPLGCRQHPPTVPRAERGAHVPVIERQKAMQVPSILQGESRTRLLQGMAIGAVASMIVGFSWGGWVTGGTADKLAAERANTAVLAALTPICVEKFLQNSEAKANLASLQKISSTWEQGQYLEKGGWATPPGATASDYQLARACAEKLAHAKTVSQ
jgi:hypothetical protein